jgi:hypothetical protein
MRARWTKHVLRAKPSFRSSKALTASHGHEYLMTIEGAPRWHSRLIFSSLSDVALNSGVGGKPFCLIARLSIEYGTCWATSMAGGWAW